MWTRPYQDYEADRHYLFLVYLFFESELKSAWPKNGKTPQSHVDFRTMKIA